MLYPENNMVYLKNINFKRQFKIGKHYLFLIPSSKWVTVNCVNSLIKINVGFQ